jgi:O-antigen/teichoic acid export membrane protein
VSGPTDPTDVGVADAVSPESAPAASLGSQAARGLVWTSARALFVRALSLVSFVILARLLDPQDYGVVALAVVFSSFAALLATNGLAPALVQRPAVDKTDLDTAFWMSFGLASCMAAALAVAAWPLAAAFDEPRLRAVLQVLCVPIFVTGIGSAHQAVLQRRLAFDAVAKAGMIANLIATAVGVAFAFLGFGVWALVAQMALAPAGTTVGMIVRSGYRPGLDVSLTRLRSLFRFSRNVVGMSMMGFVTQRSSDLLIGAFIGTAALGIYTVAYRLLVVMLDVLVTSVQGVIFPVFSRVQTDRARLRQAYLSASRMGAAITFPCFLFVMATTPEIVNVVFGAKWEDSIPVMEVLCLVGPVWAVMQLNAALLYSIGRPQVLFRLSVAGALLQVVLFLIAMPFGLVWVAAAYVARLYVITPIGLLLASRALQSRLREFLGGLAAPIAAAAAMVVAIEAAAAAIGDAVPTAVALVMLGAIALPVYVMALRLAGPAHFAEARRYAGSIRSSSSRVTDVASA